MSLAKDLGKVLVYQLLEYAKDEEKMADFWEWAEDKANDTDTGWDDMAVSAAKTAWPSLVEMAEDFIDGMD